MSAWGRIVAAHPRVVLLVGLALMVLAGFAGANVSGKLASGGYTPSTAESAVAQRVLSDRLHNGTPNLILIADPSASVDSAAVAQAGSTLASRIGHTPGVAWVRSYWDTHDPALRSTDGRSALVLVRFAGDDDSAQKAAQALVPQWRARTPGMSLLATGEAQVNAEVVQRSDDDLVRAELIGAPLTILILLLVFGSPLAALLPVAVGAAAVLLTTALLDGLASVTQVSEFALNVTTALGFGLAVDYSLLLISRYREELAAGRSVPEAIAVSVARAGRTALFSALTVAASLSALLVFPLYFLRSLAYAAIPVVLIAGLASITVLPALLAVLRGAVFRFDVRKLLRRNGSGGERRMWYRLASGVMRRPVLAALPVVAVLAVLGVPFLGVHFGLSDYHVLPASAPSHQAATALERDFPAAAAPTIEIAIDGGQASAVTAYAAGLSTLPGVRVVESPPQPGRTAGTTSWVTVVLSVDRYGSTAQQLVTDIRARPAPGTRYVGGDSAVLVDTKQVIGQGLGWAIAIIAVSTFVLLFLFTGGLLVPLNALVLNVLSLTASFGAMVYIFQDGHLRWLVGDFTSTGYLEITVPVLMFCVAFGLSMDYEVFLLSRIREAYEQTRDNTKAVATGLERTGSLFTAAALVVTCALGVLATSQLSLLKLLGVGLAIAVLVDAVLIRSILVPAFMRLAGRANWWSPKPLARLHQRIGLREDSYGP